jgi:peptidoglycan/xylan/chitin deacetylase (PgdA/CDA1 family)
MDYSADHRAGPVQQSTGEPSTGEPGTGERARGQRRVSQGQPAARPANGSCPAVRRTRAGQLRAPLVLMYHSITPYSEDPYLVTVSPDRFEQQMRWLDRQGLRGVSMATLLVARQRQCDAGLVGLTFDDGYDDFRRHALPVLQRYGFTATAFVIAGRLGGDNGWDEQGPRKDLMTARQVREVAAAGMEIGSHGLRHVTLTSTTDLALQREQLRSREILQDVTGTDVAGFCYPYGYLDPRVVDGVRGAGYDYGCAIWASELTGRYALPRVYVGEPDGGARLRVKRLRHQLTCAPVPPGDNALAAGPDLATGPDLAGDPGQPDDPAAALAGTQPGLRRSA